MKTDAKLRARVLNVLRVSSVFGTLSDAVIQDLADVLSLQTVRGGDIVVREGDVSSSMLFVISGALRISRRDASGNLLLFNEIRPGASFGEAGLILQQNRAADVSALRDSTLAVLHRNDYEALITRHPLELNRVFVQAIYNYLRHNVQAPNQHAESVVVVPLSKEVDASEVARGLTEAFARMGTTHRLSLAEHGAFSHSDGDRYSEEIARQEGLEGEYDYLVYETDVGSSAWTQRAFRQADQVVFVASPNSSPDIGALERQLMEEPGYAMKRRHLVVLHPSNTIYPSHNRSWLQGRDIERIYPTRRDNAGDYARLARFLTGKAVGIVLGGGGARGFAHLGVLRALHEAGIAIDLIGGNSMGALIGAQYACDVSLDDIRERTQKFAAGGERPTLPLISLVSGNRVRRDLVKMFGDLQVDGLWRPYFAAACNLTKGCTTVQDSGPLWRAVLASNSPAGLFPPVLIDGDLLVDGAILENVPVAAMRMRLGTAQERRRGNGTIIAVDVDVQEELSAPTHLSKLSVWSTFRGLVSPQATRTPGIGQIMYRAGHIGGLNKRAQTIGQSDHYLEPPVSQFSLMSYRNAAEIAEVGYRYTMEQMAKWKR
jgi:NTE family protein/lysophospholipid hydrolase